MMDKINRCLETNIGTMYAVSIYNPRPETVVEHQHRKFGDDT